MLIVVFANNNCSSVKKAFDPERKNGSDEFLVEKKSPLSMPPDFNELPFPQNKNLIVDKETEDFKVLLEENNIFNDQPIPEEQNNSEIESSIIEKIKKN